MITGGCGIQESPRSSDLRVRDPTDTNKNQPGYNLHPGYSAIPFSDRRIVADAPVRATRGVACQPDYFFLGAVFFTAGFFAAGLCATGLCATALWAAGFAAGFGFATATPFAGLTAAFAEATGFSGAACFAGAAGTAGAISFFGTIAFGAFRFGIGLL
jgi:hypothetical protein